jgi:hypothetical protein
VSVALALLLFAASPAAVVASPPSEAAVPHVRGEVRQAGTREPLVDVTVLAVPAAADAKLGEAPDAFDPNRTPPAWVRSTQTDDAGHFVFEDLPGTRVRLLVSAPGHTRLEFIIDPARPPRRGLKLFATPAQDTAYRTVVETEAEPEPGAVARTVLDAEEVRTAPGTQGDPLRALQNLPGVARTPGGLGLLVLRGASPSQSRVFMGGHPLPRAFHSLALSSVVPAAAIDRLEFVPSNFGVRYGDATGGVVVLHPAQLQRRALHGHARADLLGLGTSVGGPVGRGAFFAAAQRGWVDAVLRTVEAVDPSQTYLLPRYYDYQGFFEYPVGPGGSFSARVLGAGDRVQSRVPPPGPVGSYRVGLEIGAQFHRADLSYRVRRGRSSFWITPSFRVERNHITQPVADAGRYRTDVLFSLRAEAKTRVSPHVEVLGGADLELDRFRSRQQLSESAITGVGLASGSTTSTGLQTSLGSYVRVDLRARAWTVSPGVRVSAFTIGAASKAAVDPRLVAHWSFAPRWRWSMGAGVYSQAVVPQLLRTGGFVNFFTMGTMGVVVLPPSIRALEPRAGFAPRADAIELQQAFQVSLSLSRSFGEFWYVELGAWGRVADNADGIRYQNDGTPTPTTWTWGTAYGLEATVRRRLGPRLWGWMGYTLSRSERRVFDADEHVSRATTPTDFDQRHNLVLLASYRLPRRWRIGGRFRLVNGAPYSEPVGVVWIPPTGTPIVVEGTQNGSRFPIFHQLDLRVDKTWVHRRTSVGVYLDVQNVYNRINPEAFIYDFDLQNRTESVGMPIFPSLGMRVDF